AVGHREFREMTRCMLLKSTTDRRTLRLRHETLGECVLGEGVAWVGVGGEHQGDDRFTHRAKSKMTLAFQSPMLEARGCRTLKYLQGFGVEANSRQRLCLGHFANAVARGRAR